MLATRQLTAAIDFHSRKRNIMEVNGNRQPLAYQHSSQYLLLCSAEIHTGLGE